MGAMQTTVENPGSIHQFWFGSASDDRVTAQQQSALWWSKNPALDQQIRQRFEPSVLAAQRAELDAWAATPDGLLALILLTDQLPRNMYRGAAGSFRFDALARGWCRLGLERQFDATLRPLEAAFFYLPLEHSEQLADQELAVALFRALIERVPAERQPEYQGYLNFALKHHAIIARFGRFPHRNHILGRASSVAELEFLSGPDASF